jgi:hypothetical protein
MTLHPTKRPTLRLAIHEHRSAAAICLAHWTARQERTIRSRTRFLDTNQFYVVENGRVYRV